MKTMIFLLVLLIVNYYMAYCMGWIKRAKDTNQELRALLDEAKAGDMETSTFIDRMFDIQTSPKKEPYFFRLVGIIYDKFKKQPSN